MNNELKIVIIIYLLILIEYCVITTIIILKTKKNSKTYSLIAFCIFTLLWLFFIVIEKLFIGTDMYISVFKFSVIFAQLSSASVLIYVIYALDLIKHEKRHLVLLLYVPRIICFIPYFHGSFFNLVVEEVKDNAIIINWGPIVDVGKLITIIYILASLVLITYNTIRYKNYYLNNILLFFAVLLPLFSQLMNELKVLPSGAINYSPIVLSIVIVLYAISIFKLKNSDVINGGIYELFMYTKVAVVISNKKGYIEDYNNSFKSIYKKDDIVYGKTEINYVFRQLLTTVSNDAIIKEILSDLENDSKKMIRYYVKLDLESGNSKYYTLDIFSILGRRKKYKGKIIVLDDMTKERETNITEERNRISVDLHNALGSSINVISLNLEHIIKEIENKNNYELNEILECSKVAYGKSINAFFELRRIIDNIYPINIEKNGIIWALQSFFKKVCVRGINIEFDYSNIDNDKINEKKLGECLYSICKEAISNSIIHGNADIINIFLKQSEKEISLKIIDNGVGCEKIIANIGMTGMEKTISDLNGIINVGSIGEDGFIVQISIPI